MVSRNLQAAQQREKKELHNFSSRPAFLKIPETPKVFLLKKFKKHRLILLNNF
jgi:hypothetical protein